MTGPDPSWTGRYQRLLQASGLDPRPVLSSALAQIPHSVAEGGWSLALCLSQPEQLLQQVHQEYPGEDCARQRARLSVLQQDLALQVITPLLLRLFLERQTALPDPERIFLAPPRPGSRNPEQQARWYMLPGAPVVQEERFIQVTGKRLQEWYPVFRKSLGVSPGAWWSSMGLALGAPFSAVWNLAEPAQVCALANEWLEAVSRDAARYIDWIPCTFNGRLCAIPQRRGCCLKYRLPGESYCGTCSVYRKERLAELSRQSGKQRPWPEPPAR